jgi:putative methyltransferase (TIGR04325 family)
MISPWKVRRVVNAVTPPFLLAALLRVRDRLPGLAPEWRACFEYVPEGWDRLRSGSGIAGWNAEAVRAAYEGKVDAFVDALEGAGPLTVSTSPSRQASVEGSLYDQNLNLTYAYSLALAAESRKSVSVLDWGGGVGLFALLAQAVLPGVAIEYHCKDVPIVCETGRRLFPDLTFHEDDACLERKYDLVLASGSLEYSENWGGILAGLAGATGRYLYLARMPVCFEHPSFVALHRLHIFGVRTEALAWVFNRGELLAAAEAAGMALSREFLMGLTNSVHGAPEPYQSTGFLLTPTSAGREGADGRGRYSS